MTRLGIRTHQTMMVAGLMSATMLLTPFFTGNPAQAQDPSSRAQRIQQLRQEVAEAERERQRLEQRVRRLERFEKPARILKKGADLAIEGGSWVGGPKAGALKHLYKGTTDFICRRHGC